MSRAGSLLPAVCLVLGLLFSRQAQGSACCGSGHGLGQRLNRSENAALAVSIRAANRFGSYDPTAGFFRAPSATVDDEIRADLSGLYAPVRGLQFGISVPFVFNVRTLGSDSAWNGGIGDVSASARFDILPVETLRSWPAVALTMGLTVPTGRPIADARDKLATDATGQGIFEVRPGIFWEKSFSGSAVAFLVGSLGFRSSQTDIEGHRIQRAPRLFLLAAGGPVFHNGLSLSIGLIHEHEWAPSIDSIAVPNGDRYRTALMAFAGYDLPHQLTLFGSCELDLPWSYSGQNELAAIAVSIGLRRSFPWEK